MKGKMEVEVRSGVFTGKDINAKKGDRILVPANESEQSKGIRDALKSGRLAAVRAAMDTAPAAPSPEMQEELEALREENETLKKTNAGLKGALTKSKKE